MGGASPEGSTLAGSASGARTPRRHRQGAGGQAISVREHQSNASGPLGCSEVALQLRLQLRALLQLRARAGIASCSCICGEKSITYTTSPPQRCRAAYQMQKGQRGVLIKKVLPTGPAAGVLADGDALLSFGGVQVRFN